VEASILSQWAAGQSGTTWRCNIKIEDREDAEDLEEMIAFTRRSFKVRECDRRDLTTTLNEAMGDSLFDLLPKVDRQKLTERIEGVILTAELP
jgi:hypothetical protein